MFQYRILLQKMILVIIILVFLLILPSNEFQVNNKQIDVNKLSSSEFNKLIENDLKNQKILSRRRRYLIFPEGSSLQLVYDQIIPIVDYTDKFILGVTVALAWELPSKPPSEQIEDLKDKLNKGELGLRKDENIEDIKYVDNINKKQPPANPYRYEQNKNPYYDPRKSYFMEGNRIFYRPSPNRRIFQSPSGYNFTNFYKNRYNFNYQNNRRPEILKPNNRWQPPYVANYQRRTDPWSKASWAKIADRKSVEYKTQQQTKTGNRKQSQSNVFRTHKIYPVFGKRSTDNNKIWIPNDEEKSHLKYHRRSRHELYEKIEKYLYSQGKNGSECVLKALCETGQKHHEKYPGTFVGEIMRVVFSIPEPQEPHTNHKQRIYDEAHGYKDKCTDKFPYCTESLWTSDFIF